MAMLRYSIIAVLLISIFIVLIFQMPSQSNYKNYLTNTLDITFGSTYVYDLISNSSLMGSEWIFESHVKQLNSYLDPNKYNYFITIQKDYEKAVEEKYRGIRIDGYNSSESGNIISEHIRIIIRVISIKNDFIIVNVTLMMRNGYARFGLGFDLLPITDTGWRLENESYISYFNVLNMSRILIINRINNNVQDAHGTNLGEWPFWLNTKYNNYYVVLYGINDIVNVIDFNSSKSLSGLASLIILNTSSSASSDFIVNSISISASNQIYSNKSGLANELRIFNIKPNEKDQIINILKSIENSTEAKKLLKKSFFPRTIEYENDTIIINRDTLQDMISLTDKPWKYIRIAAEQIISKKPYEVIEYERGVEYDGRIYLTNGFLVVSS